MGGWSGWIQRLKASLSLRTGTALLPNQPTQNWQWQLRNELTALPAFNVQVRTRFATGRPPLPDSGAVSAVLLILDELLTNVIKYAHPGEAPGRRLIPVEIGLEAGVIKIHIEDDGIPFDPCAHAPVDPAEADLPLEERTIGGWGLSLVRQTADSMHYRRLDGHNQLTLYKRFTAV